MVVCAPGRLAAEAPEREVRIARRRAAAEQKRVVAQTVSTVVGECKRERGRERRAPERAAAARCAALSGALTSSTSRCIFLIRLPFKMYTRPPHDDHTGLSQFLSREWGQDTPPRSRSLSASTNERKKARGDALSLSRTNTNVHSSTRRRCGSRHLRLRLGKVD